MRSTEPPPSDYELSAFATASPVMEELISLAERVTNADTSLLILGETGVGKEWLARAIHAQSPRKRGPFRAVNCAAVASSLLESELFGHEKGAFTGATRAHRGYFETADGGVLFLDEIGEMAPELQSKLLRAVQERTVERIGSEVPIDVNVRMMAATSRNLEQAMASGSFRPDLYYRLAVITLVVPPLRQRSEDIPLLVEHYLDEFAGRLNRPVRRVESAVMRALLSYSWPGNVRELINIVERAVLLSSGETLGLDTLPQMIARLASTSASAPARATEPLHFGDDLYELPLDVARSQVVDHFERAYLGRLLDETGGSVGETARRAHIAYRTLYNKMQRLGLDKADFRG